MNKDAHYPIFQFLDVEFFATVQRSRSLRYETLIFNDVELKNNLETGIYMGRYIDIM